jgi:phosphoribosylanthranilate isomerase
MTGEKKVGNQPQLLLSRPQVKVCGLTRADQALDCVRLGSEAIGCVFFPKSPRHVSDEAARGIFGALPAGISRVGVFVDASFAAIMKRVVFCGLTAVQLHGQEPPSLIERLGKESLTVIKALFASRAPSFNQAFDYRPSAFLVECGQGPLPGGNARAWDWKAAAQLSDAAPVILAGGLDPENVSQAVAQACPDAVDVSSGVETVAGQKAVEKVAAFMAAIAACHPQRPVRKIF